MTLMDEARRIIESGITNEKERKFIIDRIALDSHSLLIQGFLDIDWVTKAVLWGGTTDQSNQTSYTDMDSILLTELKYLGWVDDQAGNILNDLSSS